MEIYEPAEDSFLLLKNINFSGKTVLDMGTGSGILALHTEGLGNSVTAVDINPDAIEKLEIHSEINLIVSDLFENVKDSFDVILFNAPYLPTENEDIIWDGGIEGRDVIKRFAEQVDEHLNPNGYILLLISSLTGLEETISLFPDYDSEVIDREKIPWEELYLIKIKKRG